MDGTQLRRALPTNEVTIPPPANSVLPQATTDDPSPVQSIVCPPLEEDPALSVSATCELQGGSDVTTSRPILCAEQTEQKEDSQCGVCELSRV